MSEQTRRSGEYAHADTVAPAVVTVAYVAVFALRLCSLNAGRSPYIDSAMVFDLVGQLAKALERSGRVTAWRNGAASSYAPFLSAVLHGVEKSMGRADERGDHGPSPDAGMCSSSGNGRAGGEALPASEVGNGQDALPEPASTLVHGAASATGSPYNAFSVSDLPPEVLHFMAGPSGVEAGTLAEGPSADLQFGQSFLDDSFTDASLFSDMTFILNTDHEHHWQHPAM